VALAVVVAQVRMRWCCRLCICSKVSLFEVVCGAKRDRHLSLEGFVMRYHRIYNIAAAHIDDRCCAVAYTSGSQ